MIDRIAGVFDRDEVRGIVLAVAESGHTENPVAVGASGVATEGDGEQLERVLLLVEVEAFDPPKHLILAGDVERITVGTARHPTPGAQRFGSPIYVDVDIEMANFRDAVLRPLAAARAKRIGSDVDVRAVVVLIAQPREIARRERLLQPDDALRRRRGLLLAEESNRLSWRKHRVRKSWVIRSAHRVSHRVGSPASTGLPS
jgi:hypothetical protein